MLVCGCACCECLHVNTTLTFFEYVCFFHLVYDSERTYATIEGGQLVEHLKLMIKKKKSDILFEQKTTAINRERRFQATAEPKVRHAKKKTFPDDIQKQIQVSL